jgi:hydrogenase maturation protein HypF
LAIEAFALRISGVVQGVGFRPFVYRIASRCRLTGRVTNTPGSVIVHVEGRPEDLDAFRKLLIAEAPPAARIVRISAKRVQPAGHAAFTIGESEKEGVALSTIPPDIAMCPLCLAEFSDPANRRHGYPFINCTGCGPRFTIVTELPYDRAHTSMSAFTLCPECRGEYEDPGDRRFHAEPNACPACGPKLSVAGPDGRGIKTDDPAGDAASALRSGDIVAIRGLGGFHLAADAASDTAVRRLRDRKFREEKPFAVMVKDLAAAAAIVRLSPEDTAILSSPSAPVLLLEAVSPSPLSPAVAPGLSTVGLFLPYTPLHRLLLDRADRPLVMTSGNRTDEPIATGNEEGIERLSGIADLFLLHDREIVQRSDDSVVRRVGRRVYPIRRARGFVPAPIVLSNHKNRYVLENSRAGNFPRLSGKGRDVAGLGGELKSTFCIVKGNFAYLSQHLGDLDHVPVRDFYAETFGFFRKFLDVSLATVCRDLHPGYFTTSFAETVVADRIVSLQHHKAHLYALMAESGFSGKGIGVSFDGTGYGEDGAVWGGEFFAIDGMEMRRAASLDYFPLQGGDAAVREPWRTALSLLHETFGPEEGREQALALFPDIGESRTGLVLDAIARGINVVPSSSCGRLFDAVSALTGACRRASFEGQAPMLLEGAIGKAKNAGTYGYRFKSRDGRLAVDWREMVAGVVGDVREGRPLPVIARRFHDTVTGIILGVCENLAEETGARHVLLSGGVFQNLTLLGALLAGFRKRKMKALIHRQVPPNDGGISLGQAYFAADLIAGG